jgi:glutathione S-transferase
MLGAMFGLPLDRHPRTAAWLKRCTERPALKKAR